MGMLVHFLGLKSVQILFFPWGGGVENWHYFVGYVKLRPQEHFFTGDRNVIFRNNCVVIARKICNPATPVHDVRGKFADR